MFPYFTPWGIIVIVPLYMLHTLVLAHIVWRYGRPELHVLFIAGAIFGMYEAYITKVLWDPPWGTDLKVLGVAPIEMAVLMLFWHNFMAFIVPLFVGEMCCTRSGGILAGLPEWISKRFRTREQVARNFLIIAVLCGMFQSGNSPSPVHSLASGISTSLVVIFALHYWRKKVGRRYTMVQLLPDKMQFRKLLVLTLVFYVVTGLIIRPELLPGLVPQLVIWLVYGALFLLLYLALKRSRETKYRKRRLDYQWSWKNCWKLALVFTISSAVMSIMPFKFVAMLAGWLFFIIFGLYMLASSARFAISTKT